MGRHATAPELEPRRKVRILTLSAAAAGVGAGIALERRHLRSLDGDREYQELSAPLDGRAITVESVDGTRLHVEIFGPGDGPSVVLIHGWTEQLRFWGPVVISGQLGLTVEQHLGFARRWGEFADMPALPAGHGTGFGVVPTLSRVIVHVVPEMFVTWISSESTCTTNGSGSLANGALLATVMVVDVPLVLAARPPGTVVVGAVNA